MLNRLIAAGFAASLMVVPANRAQADLHGVVGGLLGAVIIGEAIRGNNNRRTAPQGGGCGTQCQQNREVQTALNYFGYNAGGVDGALGPNSRRAINAYENDMGFFADSSLTEAERQFLLSSYSRAQGGFLGPHQTALNTGGPRNLLRSFNDERLGRFQPEVAEVPPPVVQTPPETPVDPFRGFDVETVSRSMASHCSETQQLATAAGGNIRNVTPANAGRALSEQFCLVRDFTTRQGNQVMSSVAGMTAADIANVCSQLATSLEPILNDLPNDPRNAVIQSVQQTAGGMPQNQMIVTGQICLGNGYERDLGDVATAGALMLAAAGQTSYGEVIGHHLREGFGVTASAEQSRIWHLETISELQAGAPATILTNQAAQRNTILVAANGTAASPGIDPQNSDTGTTVLPTFTINQ